MRGLALEGGGAKGAYHIGVAKALFEKGYTFDGFVGTSIGAINAAMMVQGDFDKAIESWMDITIGKIFDEDSRRTIIEEHISEDKIRRSGKDFGLVTVSLSDLKPYELTLEDIPKGQLVNYVMASASLPIFGPETIEDKMFLDGAFYNNCPVNLLLDKGYDEVIAVRTYAFGIFHKTEDPRVKLISPHSDLGNMMNFTREGIAANIKLGYYDGLRFAENLLGRSYYIRPVDVAVFDTKLMSIPDEVIRETGKILGIHEIPAKRMLFEKIIPQLSTHIKLGKYFDYEDFIIALIEYTAEQRELDYFRIYDYAEICSLIKQTPRPEKRKEPRAVAKLISGSGLTKKKTALRLLAESLL